VKTIRRLLGLKSLPRTPARLIPALKLGFIALLCWLIAAFLAEENRPPRPTSWSP